VDAARIIVVGSVNSDVTVKVPELPRPGETVVGGTLEISDGGKGANAAVAAARLGVRTHLVALVGADERGRAARAALVEAGVDDAYVGTVEDATGLAAVLVDARGENLIAVASGANARLTARHVETALAGLARASAPTVVLAGLEVPDEAVLAAARGAAARGWPFVLNPAPARPLAAELTVLCSVLTPNEHELKRLAPTGPEALLAAGAGAVVVTLGAAGAEVHRAGSRAVRITPFPSAPVDTTGAGDAFNAALAAALADGEPLERAALAAGAAGALATRAAGARGGLPTAAEVNQLVGAHALAGAG
jgi:ribokinase